MKTYVIGCREIALKPSSEEAYDRYVDAGRRPGDHRGILLAECVVSPDPATLAAILETKPAWKRKIVAACESLAGEDLEPVITDAADHPGCKSFAAGGHLIIFRPATAAQFETWESGVRASPSGATFALVKACLVSPDGPGFDAISEAIPGLKYALGQAIVKEAGAAEELVEKK